MSYKKIPQDESYLNEIRDRHLDVFSGDVRHMSTKTLHSYILYLLVLVQDLQKELERERKKQFKHFK